MKSYKLHQQSTWLLLGWWLLLGGLMLRTGGDFTLAILHPAWVPINIVGLLACLGLAVSFHGLWGKEKNPLFYLGQGGLIILSGIQQYETFLWPLLAKELPGSFGLMSPFVMGSPLVVGPMVLMSIFLLAGYYGLRTKSRQWWLLITGIFLFTSGIIIPLRSLGLILYLIGLRKEPSFR